MRNKKSKKLLFSLAAISLSLILSSCSFINFEEKEIEIPVTQEVLDARNSYIDKLNSKYNQADYYASEFMIFEKEIIEGQNKINECTTVDDVISVYNTVDATLDKIKTIKDYENEALEKLNKEKEEAVNKIKDFANPDDYREEEKNLILEQQNLSLDKVSKAGNSTAISSVVSDYMIFVYALKTEQDYYNEELEALKIQLSEEIRTVVNLLDYEDEEAQQIQKIYINFDASIKELTSKDDVNDIYNECVNSIAQVKTSKELEREKLDGLIAFYKSTLTLIIQDKIIEKVHRNECFDIRDQYVELMKAASNETEIIKLYFEARLAFFVDNAKLGDTFYLNQYRETVIEGLNTLFPKENYENNEQFALSEISSLLIENVFNTTSVEEIDDYLKDAIDACSVIPTAEEIENVKSDVFLNEIKELYGDNILPLPACGLDKASSYDDLGKIIDYYAFYQKNDSSFICGTFNVELDFNFNFDLTDFFFYYPDLFMSCVSATYKIKKNRLYVTLNAFEFGDYYKLRYDRNRLQEITYNSDKTERKARSADFNDFPYKKYEKKISGIWNSQQLWYALQSGYCPECVPDSLADLTLKQAEKICREFVSDDMSIEEKIFAISSWIGNHQLGASRWQKNFPYNDITRRADSCLFGYPAVCQGMVKAMIVLCQVEGIEARNTVIDDAYHIDTIWKGSDGKHYITSTSYLANTGTVGPIPYSYMYITTNQQRLYKKLMKHRKLQNIVESDGFCNAIYNLYFQEKQIFASSIDELEEYCQYVKEFGQNKYANVLCSSDNYDSFIDYIKNETDLSLGLVNFYKSAGSNLKEFIIY